MRNKIIDENKDTIIAGPLILRGLSPAAFITTISLSLSNFEYEIIHPANVPNGRANRSQLGKLYTDKIKKSERFAPLSTINLIILNDCVNHITAKKTIVDKKTFFIVCLKTYFVKIIKLLI